MKIKINQKIMSVDGVETLKAEKNRDLTLRDVAISSLLGQQQGDDEKSKFTRWEIFKKIRDANEDVELTSEEITKLKKAIGIHQPPLVMGQCYDLIEG